MAWLLLVPNIPLPEPLIRDLLDFMFLNELANGGKPTLFPFDIMIYAGIPGELPAFVDC